MEANRCSNSEDDPNNQQPQNPASLNTTTGGALATNNHLSSPFISTSGSTGNFDYVPSLNSMALIPGINLSSDDLQPRLKNVPLFFPVTNQVAGNIQSQAFSNRIFQIHPLSNLAQHQALGSFSLGSGGGTFPKQEGSVSLNSDTSFRNMLDHSLNFTQNISYDSITGVEGLLESLSSKPSAALPLGGNSCKPGWYQDICGFGAVQQRQFPLGATPDSTSRIKAEPTTQTTPSRKATNWHAMYAEAGATPDSTSRIKAAPPTTQTSSGKTNWNAMYAEALSGPHDTSSSPIYPQCPEAEPPRTKKKTRKPIPQNKVFIAKPTDSDVLCGRGGRSNYHPGNQVYLDKIKELKPRYLEALKKGKTEIAQSVVDYMNNEGRARFVEFDGKEDRWYVMPNIAARTKAGQALRDNNTEAHRKARRKKYGK